MNLRALARTAIAGFMLMIVSAIPAQSSNVPPGFKKFTGAWFDILYPEDFKPVVSLHSNSSVGRNAESVFFRSPDGEVEFYIFSPQWDGDPSDIALDSSTEVMGDKSISTKNDVTTVMYTIQAMNGSYLRSYREVRSGNARHITGIKYTSKTAYNRYKARYIKFRDSLVQYAD